MSVETWIATIDELSQRKTLSKTALAEIGNALEKLLHTNEGIAAIKKQTVPTISWRRPVIKSLVQLIADDPDNTPALDLLPGIIRGENADSPNRWQALSVYL